MARRVHTAALSFKAFWVSFWQLARKPASFLASVYLVLVKDCCLVFDLILLVQVGFVEILMFS